ncbi:MAG: hypothetical protein ACKOX6_04620 [Bdellovibrio sp.]
MDKISGIIPASPRMKLMETAAAQPARPGAPAFGRPEGKNSLGDRIMLSKQMEEMRQSGQLPEPESPITYKKPEMTKKQVVEELNKKFFSNPKSVARDNDLTHSEEAFENMSSSQEFTPSSSAPKGSHDLPGNKVDTPL